MMGHNFGKHYSKPSSQSQINRRRCSDQRKNPYMCESSEDLWRCATCQTAWTAVIVLTIEPEQVGRSTPWRPHHWCLHEVLVELYSHTCSRSIKRTYDDECVNVAGVRSGRGGRVRSGRGGRVRDAGSGRVRSGGSGRVRDAGSGRVRRVRRVREEPGELCSPCSPYAAARHSVAAEIGHFSLRLRHTFFLKRHCSARTHHRIMDGGNAPVLPAAAKGRLSAPGTRIARRRRCHRGHSSR